MLKHLLAAAAIALAPLTISDRAIAQTLVDPTPSHLPESELQRAAFNIVVANFDVRGSAITVSPYTASQEYGAAFFQISGGALNGSYGCLALRVNPNTYEWEGLAVKPDCSFANLIDMGIPAPIASDILDTLLMMQ